MYYITKKTSETGKKFQVIDEKINKVTEMDVKISKQIGFTRWRGDYWSVYGGFSSLIFDEAPDKKIYKNLGAKEWMPKLNNKAGKAVQAILNSGLKLSKNELNQCVGFNGAPFKTIGFARNNDKYFGFVVDEKWNIEVPSDCEEITYTKYRELFPSEKK